MLNNQIFSIGLRVIIVIGSIWSILIVDYFHPLESEDWNQRMRHIHFFSPDFLPKNQAQLTQINADIKITEGDLIPDPAEYEILVHENPTSDWLEASHNLKAVVVPWAGITEKTREIMASYPHISFHNLHYNNHNTAELGFALLLSAAKRIHPMDRALRQNDWSPRYQNPQAMLLRNKTALILGFGEIGRALGSYCLGLGMNVIATKRHVNHPVVVNNIMVYPQDQIHNLLRRADILLIALPLTPETENLISDQEIGLMPKNSIIVNIGRGPIVNQRAFYQALVSGHLWAAASDVWYHYPKSKEDRVNTPPADYPFGELENFVLSPHRGGLIEGVEVQRDQALTELINAAARGEPIPNRVDPHTGY